MNDEQRAALVEQAEEDIVHCIAFHQRLAYADAYDIDPDSDQLKGHEGIGEGTDECAHGVMATVNSLIDRILALVAKAMLSDEAVEAGSDAMYITIKSEPGTYPLIYMEDVPDFPTGLRAALAAAGITPGDDREGGEGDE